MIKDDVRRTYAESEVNLELMDALSRGGVREINVLPDDEFVEMSFFDWLRKNKEGFRQDKEMGEQK